MQSKAKTPQEYMDSLPADRKKPMEELRKVIKKNLSKEYAECVGYGMLAYVVPLKIYPAGYHCDPTLPLGYMNLASQKNFIAVYHMGVYGNKKLLDWFVKEYPKHSKSKLDMGKACIRFKKMDDIPYKLIGELTAKLSAKEWIACYESALKMLKK
ncbi:MAG TPA: DUF1801 domain-containing protein [Bacteroidia bacterium]|jgi:hypothetical protein|nr:DUF1801 domain-containing protein [Bacteroidia bacterium]